MAARQYVIWATRYSLLKERTLRPTMPRALLVCIFELILLTCTGSAAGREYSAEALSAIVVDRDTGASIPDANVVAAWELKGGLEGGATVGWVKVMETVTDAAGRFYFPAWGPIEVKQAGRVLSGSPLLLVFKSGYGLLQLRQRKRSLIEAAPRHMSSDWNGESIRLQKFHGSIEQYSVALMPLDSFLEELLRARDCHWKQAPRFIAAIEDQNKVFSNVPGARRLADFESLDGLAGPCGRVSTYVLEHSK